MSLEDLRGYEWSAQFFPCSFSTSGHERNSTSLEDSAGTLEIIRVLSVLSSDVSVVHIDYLAHSRDSSNT
jgi:hypothetical protein